MANEIPHITYNGDSKILIRLTETVNALIDRGGGQVSLLISKTVTANGTYSAADENALGYSDVTADVHTGLLTASTVDLTGGSVSGGVWTLGASPVCYSDVYEVEEDKPYLISLGDTVGSRFCVMFSTTNTADAAGTVTGTNVYENNAPAPYGFTVYTPSDDGYITIMKDNAGTAGLETFVFDIQGLIDGNA